MYKNSAIADGYSQTLRSTLCTFEESNEGMRRGNMARDVVCKYSATTLFE